MPIDTSTIVIIAVIIFVLYIIYGSIKIVPQSDVLVVERFGKYTRTLTAGLSFLTPFLDKVAHRLSILERQLPEFRISVITRDNVEVHLETTIFYRVIDASRTVYRIRDVDSALRTAASSIVRSAAGKLELDELQSSRESMNEEIASYLREAAGIWGVEITRTEITDVIIDDRTKEAQRQQLNAERERRAVIARSEGEKRAVELAAEAKLFESQKTADAVRISADAEAYAVKVKAEADAEQVRLISIAIASEGQGAVNFEIMKRQIEALARIADSENTKTLIMPTNITEAIGSLRLLLDNVTGGK